MPEGNTTTLDCEFVNWDCFDGLGEPFTVVLEVFTDSELAFTVISWNQ